MKSWFRLFPAGEGFTPYGFLANLAIPVYFLTKESAPKIWFGLALLIVFVVMYRQLYWTAKYSIPILFVQAAITLLFAAMYHPMYAYIGFLFAYPLSKQKTSIIAIAAASFAIGMGIIVSPYIGKAGMEMWLGLLPPMFGVCVLPFIIGISANYKQMAERLQAATVQVERMAQQDERQRIARELHDTLGHTLSLISLKSEVVQKLVVRDPERAQLEARDIHHTARAALKQMRELVTEMKVVRLSEEYDHAAALCAAAGIALSITDTHYRASPSNEQPPLTESFLPLTALQESIMAMCFREALTNVVRHSRATHCAVSLTVEEGRVILSISDNGIGMENELMPPVRSGNGLAGIRERLMLVDGNMRFSARSGAGTELVLAIPRVMGKNKVGELL